MSPFGERARPTLLTLQLQQLPFLQFRMSRTMNCSAFHPFLLSRRMSAKISSFFLITCIHCWFHFGHLNSVCSTWSSSRVVVFLLSNRDQTLSIVFISTASTSIVPCHRCLSFPEKSSGCVFLLVWGSYSPASTGLPFLRLIDP